ncbi:MAG: 4'-phosphopantetheinyl transferase superfamily protein [Acidobacteriia bacterium]|nr:4'-phosphopantetheinyl transferase superfamily protein [Terriglobia bacterium]
MNVYWLEQTQADVPVDNRWLGASEAARLNAMRFAKRRADWRLGRWTAKRAVAVYMNAPGDPKALAGIEIRAAPSGAPEAFVANKPAAVTISLSHRTGIAICAVAQSGAALGCDLETIEPRSDTFVADYFTDEEQALIARASAANRPRLVTLLWSGKESALKALHEGLRLDTRGVMVSAIGASCGGEGQGCVENPDLTFEPSRDLDTWRPLDVRCTGGQVFHGWWQSTGDLVRTLVANPPPVPPILFKIAPA